MVQYTLDQPVFLHGTYVKYGSARKCSKNVDANFVVKEFPVDKQFTIW
jgi:hypothetical protein